MIRILLALFMLANGAAGPEGIRVTTDRAVDASSLEPIVKDVAPMPGRKTACGVSQSCAASARSHGFHFSAALRSSNGISRGPCWTEVL